MLKRPARLPFVLLFAVMILAGQARAWNSTGHQVVAEIAWRNIKPAVRAKVLELLKQHPHFARRLEPTDPTSEPVDYALRVFMRAATWPDMMRSARPDEREYHHAEWHYINFPIIPEGADRTQLE